jgi:hypothetical protein
VDSNLSASANRDTFLDNFGAELADAAYPVMRFRGCRLPQAPGCGQVAGWCHAAQHATDNPDPRRGKSLPQASPAVTVPSWSATMLDGGHRGSVQRESVFRGLPCYGCFFSG